MDICKNLIEISEPYYANIDDIENSIKIMDRMAENGYKTLEYIPAIFWGNYFGDMYIKKIGQDKILNAPTGNIETLSKGILITINENLMIFKNREILRKQKTLRKYFKIGKYRVFKRLLKFLELIKKIIQ